MAKKSFNFFNKAKEITKSLPKKITSKMFEGIWGQTIMIAPTMNTNDFLKSYGEIGWLFACVNRISQNVASSEWKAYKGEKALDVSMAMGILDRPNAYMSRYQLLWKTAAFLELRGKCYWYIAKDGVGRPKEIWVISPLDMWVVPDKNNYIKGYIYRAGSMEIPLEPDEVICFSLPDLRNPYDGIGPAQAAANDLEADRFTNQYVKNFFYNDARPSGIVTFPDISDDDYERAKSKWEDRYKGVDNSNKVAFVRGEGISFTPISMNIKDLDVSNLRDKTRDGILGTFGVPKSILGISDDVNRANAETAEYTFAKHTIKPILQLIMDILNNEFVPLFKEQVILKFTDPVPENKEFIKSVIDTQVDKSITKNEAREILNKLLGSNLKPLIGGDVIYQPVGLQPMGTKMPEPPAPTPSEGKEPKEDDESEPEDDLKKPKKGAYSNTVKKRIHRQIQKNNKTRQEKFLETAEPLINEFKPKVQKYLNSLKNEILKSLDDGDTSNLFDSTEWNKKLQKLAIEHYVNCFQTAGTSTVQEFKSIGLYIHKDIHLSFDIKNPSVTAAIQTRAKKITQVNENTKQKVRDIIEEMYDSEDDFTVKKIKKRLEEEDFPEFSAKRCLTIAQTETLSSLNKGTIECYKQNSDLIDGKAWLPSFFHTRQSHLDAGVEYSMESPIGVNDNFIVAGYECECPGDNSLPAEEAVNCACCMAPVIQV